VAATLNTSIATIEDMTWDELRTWHDEARRVAKAMAEARSRSGF
jgi:hypothetical protein